MLMWVIVLIVLILLTAVSALYQSRMWERFAFLRKSFKLWRLNCSLAQFLVLVLIGDLWLSIGLMNAVISCLYLAFFLLCADFVLWLLGHLFGFKADFRLSAAVAVIATLGTLVIGWQQAHNIELTRYELYSPKALPELKVGLVADAHIGTTFSGKELSSKLEPLLAQKPDVIVIAGDFVDDDTMRPDMEDAVRSLAEVQANLKYGVYFVFGNHDAGYHRAEHRGFSRDDLVSTLTKHGIKVLCDEGVALNGFYDLIGREDKVSEIRGNGRKDVASLMSQVPSEHYSIMIDHQPNDYANEAAANVDLVLSGHTHGGQLWPINRLGEWIRANDLTRGHEHRLNTDFIVTSGISDWAIRFKTGTTSEVVLITIDGQKFKEDSTMTEKIVQTAGRDILGSFAPEFAHYNDDVLFGENWNNQDIDVKTRTIITVVSLMSMGITDSSLKYHLQNARAHGVTREEIVAIITHNAFYAGWPKAWAVMGLAKEVWSDDSAGTKAKAARANEENPNLASEERFARTLMFPLGKPNTAYAQYFTGKSWLAPVSLEQVKIFNVTFEPGCRNNWHIHHARTGGGQMLIGIGGRGFYQAEGEAPVEILPGTVVNIPAGVKHWHGAASDSWFAHLAIEVDGEVTSNEWLDPVSDAEYKSATGAK